jgi:WhiB family redox-sensing transcriptional regulator
VTSLRHLEGWKLTGLCATHPDPDLWFADDGPALAAAKAVCGRCPARAVCLSKALAHGEGVGVWGGTTPADRRALAATEGLRRPSPHGAAQHGTRGMRCAAGPGGRRCDRCRAAHARYVAGWRATRRSSVSRRGIVAVVHVLETPTGTGRRRAWPGQLFLDLGATA